MSQPIHVDELIHIFNFVLNYVLRDEQNGVVEAERPGQVVNGQFFRHKCFATLLNLKYKYVLRDFNFLEAALYKEDTRHCSEVDQYFALVVQLNETLSLHLILEAASFGIQGLFIFITGGDL